MKDFQGQKIIKYSYPGFDEKQIGFLVYGKNLDVAKLKDYFRGAMIEV